MICLCGWDVCCLAISNYTPFPSILYSLLFLLFFLASIFFLRTVLLRLSSHQKIYRVSCCVDFSILCPLHLHPFSCLLLQIALSILLLYTFVCLSVYLSVYVFINSEGHGDMVSLAFFFSFFFFPLFFPFFSRIQQLLLLHCHAILCLAALPSFFPLCCGMDSCILHVLAIPMP